MFQPTVTTEHNGEQSESIFFDDLDISSNKRIVVKQCFYDLDLEKVFVIIDLLNVEPDPSPDMSMSIRFLTAFNQVQSVEVLKISEERSEKKITEQLKQENKNIRCFYNNDRDAQFNEDTIWVRYLPHSETHFKRTPQLDVTQKTSENKETRCTNKWMYALAGCAAITFFVAKPLLEKMTGMDRTGPKI